MSGGKEPEMRVHAKACVTLFLLKQQACFPLQNPPLEVIPAGSPRSFSLPVAARTTSAEPSRFPWTGRTGGRPPRSSWTSPSCGRAEHPSDLTTTLQVRLYLIKLRQCYNSGSPVVRCGCVSHSWIWSLLKCGFAH